MLAVLTGLWAIEAGRVVRSLVLENRDIVTTASSSNVCGTLLSVCLVNSHTEYDWDNVTLGVRGKLLRYCSLVRMCLNSLLELKRFSLEL